MTVGIDPSLTSAGVIVLDHAGVLLSHGTVKSSDEGKDVVSRMVRVDKMVDAIMEEILDAQPECVCLEGYSFMSKTPSSDRVEFGGVLRWHLWKAGIRFYEVTPTSLKKWATGTGSGDKTKTISALARRYGLDFATNDEFDAYALARIGMQICGMEPPENLKQAEVIGTITGAAVTGKKRAPKGAK